MADFERISVVQAKQLIKARSPVIVDVRDGNSFSSAALPGAQHVTLDTFRAFRRRCDLTKPVLVYCYHGNASQDMAQMFADFGFGEVYSMDGGYEAWHLAAADLV